MSITVNESDFVEKLPEGVFNEGDDIPKDRTVLFHMEGKVYTAPARVAPNITFKYLRNVRKAGPEVAAAELMGDVMGDSIMDALADNENLTEEEFKSIMRVVQKHTMGVAQSMLGK